MDKASETVIKVGDVLDNIVRYLTFMWNMMSFTKEWEIDPNEFLKSIKVMMSGKSFFRACSMMKVKSEDVFHRSIYS